MDLPCDFDLVDGGIVPRSTTSLWHDTVRDELHFALWTARRAPYAVRSGSHVLIDQYNPPRPDVIVYDNSGLTARPASMPQLPQVGAMSGS